MSSNIHYRWREIIDSQQVPDNMELGVPCKRNHVLHGVSLRYKAAQAGHRGLCVVCSNSNSKRSHSRRSAVKYKNLKKALDTFAEMQKDKEKDDLACLGW